MKLLLLGSTGYIGKEFLTQLNNKKMDYCILSHNNCTTANLYKYLKGSNINFIVNCAGYTGKPNVDACESDKIGTINGNILFVKTLTDICSDLNIPIGHVSSGCIYTGLNSNNKPFTEEDEPNFTFKQNNCSFYSGTKAIGEEILKQYPNHYIWRLRIPFENINNPRNYITKMLNYKTLLNSENSLSNKQEFVSACIQSIEKEIPYGIYNITNTGYVTTKQVTEMLKSTIAKNREFNFFDNDEEFYKKAAKTPRSNCVLDNNKILSCGIKLSNAEDSLMN